MDGWRGGGGWATEINQLPSDEQLVHNTESPARAKSAS